ncbi:polyketide antibiotic transporter [Actinophytocola gossypii]|uniref:Polyketide antibiotic transporter n=1 Tax=Actinophytocola gossypii TaxID=2812003 RepID=A0ABT2J994_9PSEU|nr:polyketide antibiotic transporter [Actinophytocola gossypii]MCT2584435.1 polyketide antibiotic transporter [Actinophytocola gossypii]
MTALALRLSYRGALVVAVAAGGMSALVAATYRTTIGALDGSSLRALAENPAIRVLFGPPLALDDPGGFTVWRTGTAVAVLVSAWAMLTATRLTRGEEDAGRAEQLLAGRLTPTGLAVRALAAVSAGVVVAGVAVSAGLVAGGAGAAGAVVHGAGVAGTGLVFAGVGVLAGQVMPSRGGASGFAAAVLGVALLARMLGERTEPLGWVTPFGLAGRSVPFAGNRMGPLLVLAALAVGFACVALLAARGRDLGQGRVRHRVRRRPRFALLGSVGGFAVRRAIGPTLGWTVGVAGFLLFVGSLVGEIVRFLDENRRLADLAAGAGFTALGTPEGFAAAMFGVVSIPAGVFAASRIAALTADEAARRTTPLLALPVSRARHLGTEVAVTAAALLVLLAVAGVAYAAGSGLRLGAALAGTLTTAPVALLSLGAAALAHGWLPRAVLAVGALPAAGGFLLHAAVPPLAPLTPYAHLAPVPAAPPNWPAALTMVAIAAALTHLGIQAYRRRDLRTR